MALFSKKMEAAKVNTNADARIKVLGSGCKKCLQLEANVNEALAKSNKEELVGHIYEMETIVGYGVMSTPALVVDEKVVSTGKVLSVEEILNLL